MSEQPADFDSGRASFQPNVTRQAMTDSQTMITKETWTNVHNIISRKYQQLNQNKIEDEIYMENDVNNIEYHKMNLENADENISDMRQFVEKSGKEKYFGKKGRRYDGLGKYSKGKYFICLLMY